MKRYYLTAAAIEFVIFFAYCAGWLKIDNWFIGTIFALHQIGSMLKNVYQYNLITYYGEDFF